MGFFFKHGPFATLFGDNGESVQFTKVGENFAMGSDGSTVTSTPGSNSFTVISPDGSMELFTKSPLGNTAFGSNGTSITDLGSGGGFIFKP